MSRSPNRSAVVCVTTIAFESWARAGFSATIFSGATTSSSASCVSVTLAFPPTAPSVRNESAEPAYSGTRSINPSARAGWTSSLGPPCTTGPVGYPFASNAWE